MVRKWKRYLIPLLCLSLLSAAAFGTVASADDSLTVRVGIYQNSPKIFTDDSGNAAGFWPDIVNYIASRENWQVEWVPGTWNEGLTRLENREIDIMPDVAYTEARDRLYDFSEELVYLGWSRVYAREDTDIQSVLDLAGKTIAVLEGSVNYQGSGGIKELLSGFDIESTFIEADSYDQVFELVASGAADAGVANRDFANRHLARFHLAGTAIIFQPASLYFAFPGDSSLTPALVERIDYHLKELKADEDSIYHQSIQNWLGVEHPEKEVVPVWLLWVLAGVGGTALLFAGGDFILRARVRARTRELTGEIAERQQAEAALRESETRHRTTLENMMEGCQIIGFDWRYLYLNDATARHGRRTKEELLGKTMMEAYPGIEDTEMFTHLRRCMAERVSHRMENRFTYPDGSSAWFELSIEPVPEGIFILSLDITQRQRAEEEIRLFLTMTREISESPDLDSALEVTLSRVCQTTGWDYGEVWLPDPDGKALVFSSAWHGGSRNLETFRQSSEELTFPPGVGLPGQVWETKKPEWIPDVLKVSETVYIRSRLAAEAGLRAGFAVPIMADEEVLAVLVFYLFESRPDDARLVELVSAVAAQLGSVIKRRLAEARVAHLTLVLRAVRDVNQLITRERERQSLVRKTCELLVENRNYREAWILLLNGNSALELAAHSGLAEDANAVRERLLTGDYPPCVRQLLAQENPLLVLNQPGKQHRDCILAFAHRNAIVLRCKLEHDGRLYGVLGVAMTMTTWVDKEEQNLFLEVCDDIAFALASIAREGEHRQSEEEIARFKTVSDLASYGITMLDGQRIITYSNKTCAELHGYAREELTGEHCAILVPENEMPTVDALFDKSERTGGFINEEITHQRKDGTTFPALMTGVTVKGDSGEVLYTSIIFVDITEQKKAQAQLMATDRLASVGELAAGIAHEINNPLTGVIGFSDLLMKRQDIPEDIREFLGTINQEALRASQVARNLLIFSRKHPDEKQPVDINKIIELVLELRAYEQRVHNIEVATRLAADLPTVLANDFQLQQVLVNIIINAEHFMLEAHGKGNLNIITETRGDMVRATIADDGPGIKPEHIGHIFDPFYTTKEVGKGTGLGLSICHGITTEHGGRIYAESQPGKGATFIVELPAHRDG